SDRARKEALLDLAEDAEPPDIARAALRSLRLSRDLRQRRGLLPRARPRPYKLARRARSLQGLHLDAEAERLPLDPHHDRRPAPPARRAATAYRAHACHGGVRRRCPHILQGCLARKR